MKKAMKHSDAAMDKKLIKSEIKKAAVKDIKQDKAMMNKSMSKAKK